MTSSEGLNQNPSEIRYKGLKYGSPALNVVLQREQAGPEQVVHKKHLRRKLPPEEYGSRCSISSETADHLPL